MRHIKNFQFNNLLFGLITIHRLSHCKMRIGHSFSPAVSVIGCGLSCWLWLSCRRGSSKKRLRWCSASAWSSPSTNTSLHHQDHTIFGVTHHMSKVCQFCGFLLLRWFLFLSVVAPASFDFGQLIPSMAYMLYISKASGVSVSAHASIPYKRTEKTRFQPSNSELHSELMITYLWHLTSIEWSQLSTMTVSTI